MSINLDYFVMPKNLELDPSSDQEY